MTSLSLPLDIAIIHRSHRQVATVVAVVLIVRIRVCAAVSSTVDLALMMPRTNVIVFLHHLRDTPSRTLVIVMIIIVFVDLRCGRSLVVRAETSGNTSFVVSDHLTIRIHRIHRAATRTDRQESKTNAVAGLHLHRIVLLFD